MIRRIVRDLGRCTRGAAAVEFAIISLVLVTLAIGIVDFGRTLYTKNQLSFLADQATRKLLLNPNLSSTTLESELRGDFTAGDPSSVTITITDQVVNSTTYRLINIDFPMTLFIPNLASGTLALNVKRRVPVS